MYNTVTVLKKIEELLSGTKHIFHINLMFFAKKKKKLNALQMRSL